MFLGPRIHGHHIAENFKKNENTFREVILSVTVMMMKCSHIKFWFPLNPIALRTAKTLRSFSHSECNRVKQHGYAFRGNKKN